MARERRSAWKQSMAPMSASVRTSPFRTTTRPPVLAPLGPISISARLACGSAPLDIRLASPRLRLAPRSARTHFHIRSPRLRLRLAQPRSARTHFRIRSPRLRLRLAHQVDGIPHAASCAERLGLHGVAEPDAPGGAVPHGAAHLLHHVRAGQHDVGDPVAAEQVELVGEKRDVEQRDDGLGARQRERAESACPGPRPG